jgi:hypothetical protein
MMLATPGPPLLGIRSAHAAGCSIIPAASPQDGVPCCRTVAHQQLWCPASLPPHTGKAACTSDGVCLVLLSRAAGIPPVGMCKA